MEMRTMKNPYEIVVQIQEQRNERLYQSKAEQLRAIDHVFLKQYGNTDQIKYLAEQYLS